MRRAQIQFGGSRGLRASAGRCVASIFSKPSSKMFATACACCARIRHLRPCLAPGIGANTAVFSAVHILLIQPFPYVHPEQLLIVSEVLPKLSGDDVGVAAGEYLDYRNRNHSFAQVAAYQNDGCNLTGGGPPLRISANRATASLFPLLGVRPIVGRTFADEEARQGADAVVVISHDLWQRHYGGDLGILGKIIKLDEKPYTVIGVMPASFRFPSDSLLRPTQLSTPLLC